MKLTMSMFASKDDLINGLYKRIEELEREIDELHKPQTLQKVAMEADELIPDKMYLWAIPGDYKRLVWLSDERDGLQDYDEKYLGLGFTWWFENDLIGQLYGPIEINEESER